MTGQTGQGEGLGEDESSESSRTGQNVGAAGVDGGGVGRGTEASGPNMTDQEEWGRTGAGAPAPGRRGDSPEVAAFHLCAGAGRDQQEEAATSTNPPRSRGCSESNPCGLGQAPYLLALACAQDSRGSSGDPPQNRNHAGVRAAEFNRAGGCTGLGGRKSQDSPG